MPDKNLQPGVTCWLTGNIYDDEILDKAFDNPRTRVVTVRERADYDEEWGQKWHVQTAVGAAVVSEADLSPMPDLTPGQTERGFGRIDFRDLYGSSCSIQESSLATEGALWLGVDSNGHFSLHPPFNRDRGDRNTDTGGRMHLSQGQAAALLPLLEHFVSTGRLPQEKTPPKEDG